MYQYHKLSFLCRAKEFLLILKPKAAFLRYALTFVFFGFLLSPVYGDLVYEITYRPLVKSSVEGVNVTATGLNDFGQIAWVETISPMDKARFFQHNNFSVVTEI